MKIYKVVLSPYFVRMLKEELKHYAIYNLAYAHKIEKKVLSAINFIQIFPYACPTIKLRDDVELYRKFVVKKRFLIIFKILDNRIHLDYFIDGRQNPKNYFKLYKK